MFLRVADGGAGQEADKGETTYVSWSHDQSPGFDVGSDGEQMKALEQCSSMAGFLLFKDHFGWCRVEARSKGPRGGREMSQVVQIDKENGLDRVGEMCDVGHILE